MMTKKIEKPAAVETPAAAEKSETFQLLDAAGAPAKNPESAVPVVIRRLDGRLEVSPFRWGLAGYDGSGYRPVEASAAVHPSDASRRGLNLMTVPGQSKIASTGSPAAGPHLLDAVEPCRSGRRLLGAAGP